MDMCHALADRGAQREMTTRLSGRARARRASVSEAPRRDRPSKCLAILADPAACAHRRTCRFCPRSHDAHIKKVFCQRCLDFTSALAGLSRFGSAVSCSTPGCDWAACCVPACAPHRDRSLDDGSNDWLEHCRACGYLYCDACFALSHGGTDGLCPNCDENSRSRARFRVDLFGDPEMQSVGLASDS